MDYSYYGRKAPNQMVGYISNPCEGLNEFVSPIRIGDNQLSDCMNVMPYRNSSILMNPIGASNSSLGYSGAGVIAEAICAFNVGIPSIGYFNDICMLGYRQYGSQISNGGRVYSQSGTTVYVTLVGSEITEVSIGKKVTVYDHNSKTGVLVGGTYEITFVGSSYFTYTAPDSKTASGTCIVFSLFYERDPLNPPNPSYPPIQSKIDITGTWNYITSNDPQNAYYSACNYSTQAESYVVFSCSSIKKLYYNASTNGVVDIPFYPKRIISHANRIFAIDINNTIWWSKAGSFVNATDWYGIAPSGSSVIEDSGYWVIERERLLSELFVIDNNLFIFGTQNIYIFSGYSYDTFALQIAFPNFGIETNTRMKLGCQANKNVYFISKYNPDSRNWLSYNESEYYVYEFNGSNYPTIINKPIIESNQITNGMLGSIDPNQYGGMTHISADNLHVYLYKEIYTLSSIDNVVYVFDIFTRTWWKRDGFYSLGTGDMTCNTIYVPSVNKNITFSVSADYSLGEYVVRDSIGFSTTYKSYIVTKAFSSLPTDKETLTAIIFQLEATAGTDLAYTLSISNSIDQDDFKIAKQVDHHIATGTIENIEVFLPISLVPNVRQYRIKLQVFNGKCYIYNIERRFRVRGRSR